MLLNYKNQLLISLGILIIAAIIFSSLSDLNKAKCSLQLLGIHQKNKACFAKVTKLIIEQDYHKCTTLGMIRTKDKALLLDFFKNNRSQDSTKQIQLSAIYASNGERWNSACQLNSSLPQQKFEYLLYADKSLILCSLVGGLGISSFYEFYEITEGKLVLLESINVPTSSLFLLATILKFDKNRINCEVENNWLLK